MVRGRPAALPETLPESEGRRIRAVEIECGGVQGSPRPRRDPAQTAESPVAPGTDPFGVGSRWDFARTFMTESEQDERLCTAPPVFSAPSAVLFITSDFEAKVPKLPNHRRVTRTTPFFRMLSVILNYFLAQSMYLLHLLHIRP
jgi:hypothetical protein